MKILKIELKGRGSLIIKKFKELLINMSHEKIKSDYIKKINELKD